VTICRSWSNLMIPRRLFSFSLLLGIMNASESAQLSRTSLPLLAVLRAALPFCSNSCLLGYQKLTYLDTGNVLVACFKAYTQIFLFDGSCQSSMDYTLYNYQCPPLYDARALCIGTRDGSPCERAARKYGRSQALLKLDSCSGSLSEHSYQMQCWLSCDP
jgi:hypothetical protein